VPGLKAEKGEKGSIGKRGRAVIYRFICADHKVAANVLKLFLKSFV